MPDGCPTGAQGLRAVVFDVDGTLYDQRRLRMRMLAALVKAHLLRPVDGWRTATALSAYRRAQEEMRRETTPVAATAQIERAAARAGHSPEFVRQSVERWMESAPLAFLAGCRQPDLIEFLDECRTRGLRLAVLSDYPAGDKLAALGLAQAFDVALCAQSAEIGRFKPDPRGLLVTLERLGVQSPEALYVGDRADVDAAAASAAGVACAIVSRRSRPAGNGYMAVSGFAELRRRLFEAASSTHEAAIPK